MSKSGTIALALAALAVVIAATGTAVAVTSTQVNIADPAKPSQVAHVDNTGRLKTAGPTGTYVFSGLLSGVNGENNFVTTPTTANLALTSISLSDPSLLIGTANTEVRVFLYKVSSSSTTTCTPSAYQPIDSWNVTPGDDIHESLSVPLLVKPTGTTPYCLSLYAYPITGATYGGNYYPFGSVEWYVASGSYGGPGALRSPLSPAQVKRSSRAGADR